MYSKNKFRLLAGIRKSKTAKFISLTLVLVLFSELINPLSVLALTSGPSQPEADSFTPFDATNLVSPFSGDFSYNIPLVEVGGYPVNLSYNSGVSLDQEATWAGLGWNVNVGSITRQMRGVPDEFWGDEVTRELNMKDNYTVGANVGVGFEAFGFDIPSGEGSINLSMGLDISYNSYKGFNLGTSFSPSLGIGKGAKMPGNMNLGVGFSSSLDGMNVSPNVSFSAGIGQAGKIQMTAGLGFGLSMNSRTGLSNLTLSHDVRFSNTLKKKEASLNGNVFGGSLSFAGTSYSPQIELPFESGAFTGSFKIGAAAWGGDFDLKVGGYGSIQRLKQNTIKTPAYGYFYEEKANGKDDVLMDVNREKDGSFSESTPNLPVTIHTNDLFSINAHGLSGQFRGFRNDLGYVHDNKMQSTSFDFTSGFELNSASLLNVGFDVAANTVLSESKTWKQNNDAEQYLKFSESAPNSIKENFHFKIIGEPSAVQNTAFEDQTGAERAATFPISDDGFQAKLKNEIKPKSGSAIPLTSPKSKPAREPRNVSISYLTVKEVKNVSPRRQKYLSPHAKDHHIAEITVTHPDGKRYVFGLAAYNITQKEVTFSIGSGIYGSPASLTTQGYLNDVIINPSNIATLASKANKMGIDNYFDATILPAFVHTWFLTEVYSPDYIDLTGNGPSLDDAGNYVVFNYGIEQTGGKIVPDIADYKWRTPFSANSASVNKGLYSDPSDDKASYIYGVKEMYFLHSIESKNEVAVFNLKNRNDGYGVSGEFGGIGGSPLKAIESISLYSRAEYGSTQIPSKTIHFEHDYHLCDGVPNNNMGDGKLTLTKVWFTHKNSAKSKFSHYSFDYGENVGYSEYQKSADRWGNYQHYATGNLSSTPSNTPDNMEFPYVRQNTQAQKDWHKEHASLWNITKIGLPTGGNINIEYEPDDYAYVQNKKAARMFNIVGALEDFDPQTVSESDITGSAANRLFKKDLNPFTSEPFVKNFNYLFFRLEEGTPTSWGDQEIRDAYMPEFNNAGKFLYYRFFTNMNNGAEAIVSPKSEYVSGFAEIDVTDSKYMGRIPGMNYGYIKIKSVPVSDRPTGPGSALSINPIAKASWQFSRMFTPRYAFNQPDPDDTEFEVVIKMLAATDLVSQMINMFKGPNVRMLEKGFGAYFDQNRSWIRLSDPDGQKLGGGSRVKSITVSDEWEDMEPSEATSEYTQVFEYKDVNGKSSGVASYEPMIGADENPFRQPVFFPGQKFRMIPRDDFYQEEPYGESFFPSPSVGYSRVVVKDKEVSGSTNSGTGYIVHEFYTAKDYPTITERTDLITKRKKSNPLLALLKVDIRDFMRASQGFYVELNDMHGKAKSKKVYAERPQGSSAPVLPISSEEYKYHDIELDNKTRKLNNMVSVIGSSGEILTQKMATEYDIVVDLRENRTRTYNVNVSANIAYFQTGPIPTLIPTVFPGFSSETTIFRSAVTTKVVYKYGILKETIVKDLGSSVKKEHLNYDPITGDPLLIRVNSEFGDEQYALTMPARWTHDGMGPAFKNIGYTFTTIATPVNNLNNITGQINPGSHAFDHLFPGDELLMYINPGRLGLFNTGNEYDHRYWVAADNSGNKYIINQNGDKLVLPSGLNRYFKVIRSGRRNMNSVPTQEVTSLVKPVNSSGNLLELNSGKKILSSTATEYAEQWAMNTSNVTDQCVTVSKLDEVGNALVTWLNYLVQTNQLNAPDPIPISNFISTFDSQNPSFAGCETAGFIQTGLSSGSPFSTMTLNIENCLSNCSSVNFYVYGQSPVQFDVFNKSNLHLISYFSPVVTVTCRTEAASDIANGLYISVVLTNGSTVILRVDGWEDCVDNEIIDNAAIYNCAAINLKVNPYLSGNLGNWRAQKGYAYLTDRVNQSLDAAVDVRHGGYFNNYVSFWTIPSSPSVLWQKTSNTSPAAEFWQWTSEMTAYGISGNDVENKSPVNETNPIFSSALYGYHNMIATAVASNARYREIAFDGFEDYYTHVNTSDCFKDHFRFESHKDNVVNEAAHTGFYSLKIPASTTFGTDRTIEAPHSPRSTRAVPYLLESGDLLGLYSPPGGTSNYKFIVSFWAKPSDATPETFDFTGIAAQVKYGTTTLSGTLVKSKRVEGWQKFEYLFTGNPTIGNLVRVELVNSRAAHIYIDDLRIHPYNSNIKSYVYDLNTLKLMAELDENNFATFYEYDEDGKLVRVKKETERGIVTLKENRSGTVKKPLQ